MSQQHDAPTPRVAPIDFFVIGAPRSGTTLARRLACELPGVSVSPETHFVARSRHRPEWRRFPMDEAALRAVGERFMTGLRADLDTEALLAVLGGRADGPAELFAGIVRSFAPTATIVGEKTPEHVRHWRQLLEWFPEAKLIALVRDPRQQVASQRHEDWGTDRLLWAATRWRDDDRALLAARDALPPSVLLLLHHRDLVSDPDAARARIAEHLGVSAEGAVAVERDESRSGDARAWDPVDAARAAHRAGELGGLRERAIASICRREMVALDLDPSPALPGVVGDALAAGAVTRHRSEEALAPLARRVRRLVRRG